MKIAMQVLDAVKTHAQHIAVMTDKDGIGTLTIYRGDGVAPRVHGRSHPCFPNPNKPASTSTKSAQQDDDQAGSRSI